jgi:putative component of membrane protein insertase Oxa1/YidC/SpoIIIJ protein YidD
MASVIANAGDGDVAAMPFQAVDSALRVASISCIDWYRREVSPRKGFACAHRVRHGGESCSQFARRALETGRWWPGVRATVLRLRHCGEAARDLRRERDSASVGGVHDEYLDGELGRPKSGEPVNATDRASDCPTTEIPACCVQGCLNSCVVVGPSCAFSVLGTLPGAVFRL